VDLSLSRFLLMLQAALLDDYSRYIISWKLCTNMKTEDVTDTLKLALEASGYGRHGGYFHQGRQARRPHGGGGQGPARQNREACGRECFLSQGLKR